jgi:hypothetical protein
MSPLDASRFRLPEDLPLYRWFEEGSPTIQRMVIARAVLVRFREG